jgi:hypothetical protein
MEHMDKSLQGGYDFVLNLRDEVKNMMIYDFYESIPNPGSIRHRHRKPICSRAAEPLENLSTHIPAALRGHQ